ncbi:3-hydroxybutyrate dehydrogenase [Fodinicurvata sp. EGI_FJ10296]|uniref:3-hydroxybutyrate dehydrogenase n=1 Tax=Fodinicurvata sp. EGI_FJ10296 TaxID=3231908 RepID=UPI003454EE4F
MTKTMGNSADLSGRVAVVTGSTSGIGYGIARHFALAGCNIVLNGLGDADRIEETRAGLAEEFGVSVLYDGADMTRPDLVRGMIADATERLGSVDILVNNAGIQHTDRVENFPTAKWDAIIAINMSSAFHSSAAAVPGMRERGWGRIINIASAHGLVASANKSAYVAAKHGLVGMTKVIALENAGSGVTCNAICPGWVRTPLVERQIEQLAKENGTDVESAAVNLLSAKQPSHQFVTPEQLGGTALFLCSPAAAQITGTSLSVDGGWTAQ